MSLIFLEADQKQQQSSSDGDPVKKKSRTSTTEQQGAPSDGKRDNKYDIVLFKELLHFYIVVIIVL